MFEKHKEAIDDYNIGSKHPSPPAKGEVVYTMIMNSSVICNIEKIDYCCCRISSSY